MDMTSHSLPLARWIGRASLAVYRVTLGFDYGVRDCAFRAPARNMTRIQEER